MTWPQFKLKHYAVAVVWFVIALPRWQDWMEERYWKRSGLAPHWVPMVPSWTFVPLLIASALMVVGLPRVGFAIGSATTLYVVYRFCDRWMMIRSMGLDPMDYWN